MGLHLCEHDISWAVTPNCRSSERGAPPQRGKLAGTLRSVDGRRLPNVVSSRQDRGARKRFEEFDEPRQSLRGHHHVELKTGVSAPPFSTSAKRDPGDAFGVAVSVDDYRQAVRNCGHVAP